MHAGVEKSVMNCEEFSVVLSGTIGWAIVRPFQMPHDIRLLLCALRA